MLLLRTKYLLWNLGDFPKSGNKYKYSHSNTVMGWLHIVIVIGWLLQYLYTAKNKLTIVYSVTKYDT